MSADCSKLICMPRSSLKVSETVMPSILQSEKSRSLRGVLKKSAPLKTEAAKVSFFRRTSAQKDSLKEQLLTAEFSHCDLEKLAYAKELSHKVNSLQQLCEKSGTVAAAVGDSYLFPKAFAEITVGKITVFYSD